MWIEPALPSHDKVASANIFDNIIPAVLADTEKLLRTRFGDIIANELIRDVKTVAEDYTANEDDDLIFVDATATITLPTAVGLIGYFFVIKNIKSGATVTIDATGNETIDGEFTKVITQQNNSLTFVSNNVNWFIL